MHASRHDGRLVGNATLHLGNNKRRHTGDVGIMVHDDYVNQGIGRALMERLLDLADTGIRQLIALQRGLVGSILGK